MPDGDGVLFKVEGIPAEAQKFTAPQTVEGRHLNEEPQLVVPACLKKRFQLGRAVVRRKHWPKVQRQIFQSAKIALWIALWKNWLCFARSPQNRRSRKRILLQRSANRSARSKHGQPRCRKKAIFAAREASAAAIGKCWSISHNRESDQESGYEKMRLTFASAEVNLIFLSQERIAISLQRYSI